MDTLRKNYENLPLPKLCELVYKTLAQASAPLNIGNTKVIIYRGIKVTKSGDNYIVEDTTPGNSYSRISNRVILSAIIHYETQRRKAIAAETDSK